MKKFIAFVIVLIVTVSLGVTVYYFMRDNEELVVDANPTIYINKGDPLFIDAKLLNAKLGNEVVMTSLNTNVLEWNPAVNGFEAEEGGAAVIEITTTKKTQKPIFIEVSVGNGMKEAPYFINSEESLLKIGSSEEGNIFTANDNYILMQDITITNSITPILNGAEFKGSFDGNGYSIKDLKVESGTGIESAGLFSIIGSTGVVKNLTFSNVAINGDFLYVGAVAGKNLGTITRCEIQNGSIVSSLLDSNVGSVCGLNQYSNSNFGRVDRVSANLTVKGTSNVGGLVGLNKGGIIINSYYFAKNNATIETTNDGSNIGGLIGLNINKDNKPAIVKNCYSVSHVLVQEGVDEATCNVASLIGYNDEISNYATNYIMGVYTTTSESVMKPINNEFNIDSIVTVAEKTNYRGTYTAFPKDSITNKIDSTLIKSYISKKTAGVTNEVFWDFENVWLISESENNGYPYLNKDGANVPDDLGTIYDPKIINNTDTLIDFMTKVNNGLAGSYYILDADINLENSTAFIPIGSSKHPFDGTFDGNGHKISNIKVSNTVISNLEGYKFAGLFGKISSSASIKNLTVENISIEDGATHAGALVAYNEGTISNCKVISSACNKDSANVKATYAAGGISGVNYGVIENCKILNQSIFTNSDYEKISYVGGIAGINGQESGTTQAIIKNSSVVTSFVNDFKDISFYPNDDTYVLNALEDMRNKRNYAGGIAGANFYLITKNYLYKTDIETNVFNTYGTAAGVAGISKATVLLNNNKAEVSYNKVLGGTINSHATSGLIGNQYGIAEYNHVQMDNLRGTLVAGLVNRLAINSRLRNCFSGSYLSSGEIKEYTRAAGMVITLDYSAKSRWTWNLEESYGEMSQIFSVCTFESGLKYAHYDANFTYRGESVVVITNRTIGYGNNLIWEETGNAEYDDIDKYTWGDTRQNNIKWFNHEELTLMTNAESVKSCFSNFGFDMSVWQFEEGIGEYPKIQGLPEIEELD